MDPTSLKLLPGTHHDLIMNWRELSLDCSKCGGSGRVKYLSGGKPLCQFCATGEPSPGPAVAKSISTTTNS